MEPLTLRVPSSKSETHRALLLAARSARPCRVVAPLLGADNCSTLSCLQQLGAQARLDGGDVQFTPARLRPSADALDCGNSGTTRHSWSRAANQWPSCRATPMPRGS